MLPLIKIIVTYPIQDLNCHFMSLILLFYIFNLLPLIIFSMETSSSAPKHVWTKEEEETLLELISMGGWKSDNGTFRLGIMHNFFG